MTRAFLALGSNIGDKRAYLRAAIAAMPDVVRQSPLYETDPVGGPEQDDYFNLIVQLETDRSPRQLLDLCQRLEHVAQRVREIRWGPRTLDVDVLWVDGKTADEPDLVVPHPRMFERAFVMVPLGSLASDLAGSDWEDYDLTEVRLVGDL
ncbi:MAG: 2-amino-4-hydroxy-6-hydroxymethyldihydropteridine diphosphokinase [Acidimicrobiales bacterium]